MSKDKVVSLESSKCLICGRPVPDFIPKYCCTGEDCMCMGQPVEPCVCSDECEEAVYKGIGKEMDQRRIDAGIEKYTDSPVKKMDEISVWHSLDDAARANLDSSDIGSYERYRDQLKEDGCDWEKEGIEEVLRGFIWSYLE